MADVQRAVPFFNYPRLFMDDEQQLTSIFQEVGRRGAFIMQQDLRDFEAALAAYTGAKHAVGVANATDGLELAWMAVGLRPGDEVICCSHTMLATAASIVTAGGTPVPVELGSRQFDRPLMRSSRLSTPNGRHHANATQWANLQHGSHHGDGKQTWTIRC
ncbi:MAG: DegT/DnrJ/EryC1/StrS family aminotransferase [Rhodocyclaceae bacterium]|nr:DegT/DnrJ/EryC1/StrS family aminotransferase [Rhodocyclaceae bacterium]